MVRPDFDDFLKGFAGRSSRFRQLIHSFNRGVAGERVHELLAQGALPVRQGRGQRNAADRGFAASAVTAKGQRLT